MTNSEQPPNHMFLSIVDAQKPGFFGKAGLLLTQDLLRGCLPAGERLGKP
jgi:hypothetical protein